MMLRWILAPIVGALIGYITNDIAIRMLFHPYKSYHIGGFHVPFTPGLIPAQQERIARAIGTMVSNQLLNEETLRAALLSETVLERVRSAVEEGITGLGNDTETVREFLCTRWPEEKVQLYRHRASSSAERRVVERLSDMDIDCETVEQIALETGGRPLLDRLREMEAAVSAANAPALHAEPAEGAEEPAP